MTRYAQLIGVLVFGLAVGAIQMLDHLYRWYTFREERVHLTELREELVDQGAEMIRAQLAAERVRARIAATDSLLDQRRQEVEVHWLGTRNGMPPRARYAAYMNDIDAYNRKIRERNERLGELNAIVHHRNAATARYYVLADSIRTLAARAGEPYFSVPIPAQAAAERGITREHDHLAVGVWERDGRSALRENQ